MKKICAIFAVLLFGCSAAFGQYPTNDAFNGSTFGARPISGSTAPNAANGATVAVSNNATYYLGLFASSSNGNQPFNLSTGLTYNPFTLTLATSHVTATDFNGVTYPSSFTQGGIPWASGTGAISSSALLAANSLIIGGGAGAAPSTVPTGNGILTALGVNVGTAGSPVINGGVLGSPSSAGTLPAFTLGGAISGGGNQINNVIVGASTPLAGTFTTATVNETIISSLPASKWATDASGQNFDIASAANYAIVAGGGFLFIIDNTNTQAAIVFVAGGAVSIVWQNSTEFAVTSTPSASQIGINYDGSTNYRFYNGYAVTHNFTVYPMKLRSSN